MKNMNRMRALLLALLFVSGTQLMAEKEVDEQGPATVEVKPKVVDAEVKPKVVDAEVKPKVVDAEVKPKVVDAEAKPKVDAEAKEAKNDEKAEARKAAEAALEEARKFQADCAKVCKEKRDALDKAKKEAKEAKGTEKTAKDAEVTKLEAALKTAEEALKNATDDVKKAEKEFRKHIGYGEMFLNGATSTWNFVTYPALVAPWLAEKAFGEEAMAAEAFKGYTRKQVFTQASRAAFAVGAGYVVYKTFIAEDEDANEPEVRLLANKSESKIR